VTVKNTPERAGVGAACRAPGLVLENLLHLAADIISISPKVRAQVPFFLGWEARLGPAKRLVVAHIGP
jgi:hypothetical protein